VTRELKLALIFGFSLLLVVTVLISDHLSKARDAKLAADLPEAPALVPAGPREVLVAAGPVRQPTKPLVTGDPASESVDSNPATQVADSQDTPPAELRQGRTETRVAQGDDSFIIRRSAPLVQTSTSGVGTSPGGLDEVANKIIEKVASNGSAPEQAESSTQKKPDASPASRTHTVASGETLSKIAKKYYGTSTNWKRIAEANPKSVGKNGEVRVGVKITIPPEQPSAPPVADPAQIRREPSERVIAQDQPEKRLPRTELPQGDLPSDKPAKSEIAKTGQKPRPQVQEPKGKPQSEKPQTEKASDSYVVRSGDTLSEIAQRELGNASRAKDIVRLNRDAFPDGGTAVRIGMVLKMPRG
jgi:nucleoid-associated protein YgaU